MILVDNSISELIVTDQIDDDNCKWQVHQLVDSIIMPPMIDERQVAFLVCLSFENYNQLNF
jgi:hypothetical protein